MDLEKAILDNGLTPFSVAKAQKTPQILKTRDAKKVYLSLRKNISKNFVFSATKNVLDLFEMPVDFNEIKERQKIFQNDYSNEFLKKLKNPKPYWRPEYAITAVTEDEKTYALLKKRSIPVILLFSMHDLEELRDYDIVQAIDCQKFVMQLEDFGSVVFYDTIDDIYLERYLIILSGWQKNIEFLEDYFDVSQLKELLNFLDNKKLQLTVDLVEDSVEKINKNISEKLQDTTIVGSQVFKMLESGEMPDSIKKIITDEIKSSGIPPEIFLEGIPVKIDHEELSSTIKKQEAFKYTEFSETLKKNKEKLHKIPSLIRHLEVQLLIIDFLAGIGKIAGKYFPEQGDLHIQNSKNIMLKKPEPVSFMLDENNKCSILTGANSGGKTTLLEHIIQVIILAQMGLPLNGMVRLPQIKEVYYFAKNKGKMNQGAFEALLNQMASMKHSKDAFILADEIEAITEPGVAADIISATADYFVKKGFYLVFATHLGKELVNNLPEKTRIDGIEAKGLDDKFNLILERSPVMGKLASSTPELIIQRLAKTKQDDYFQHLAEKVSK